MLRRHAFVMTGFSVAWNVSSTQTPSISTVKSTDCMSTVIAVIYGRCT